MATILIVDDEESLRCIISMILVDKYTVLEADNALEGLTMFQQHQPDLIITDMNMPGMTGLELVEKVRNISKTVKLVAFSASLRNPDKFKAMMAAGADICLPKPGGIDELELAVEKLLTC
ncbi:MAG: response regulator [Acidobacteriota bacterium]